MMLPERYKVLFCLLLATVLTEEDDAWESEMDSFLNVGRSAAALYVAQNVADLLLAAAMRPNHAPQRRKRSFWSIRAGQPNQSSAWYEDYFSTAFEEMWNANVTQSTLESFRVYVNAEIRGTVRMNKSVFDRLYAEWGQLLFHHDHSTCPTRPVICTKKRLVVLLNWLGTGDSLRSVAQRFDVSRSVVCQIVHAGVQAIVKHMVPALICLPSTSGEVEQVMNGFRGLCSLPGVIGAMDGTFVQIVKPTEWGDAYWCYKAYPAIILLALVDSVDRFMYVDIGNAGSQGDASTWKSSMLYLSMEANELFALDTPAQAALDLLVGFPCRPYIVADSAFALADYVMKCYDMHNPSGPQYCLNYAVIRTRRVVECAFGRLKGRFNVLAGNCRIRDHQFMADVGLACCALHNYIEEDMPNNQNQVFARINAQQDAARGLTFGQRANRNMHARNNFPSAWAQAEPFHPSSETPYNGADPPAAGAKRDMLARYMFNALNKVPRAYTPAELRADVRGLAAQGYGNYFDVHTAGHGEEA